MIQPEFNRRIGNRWKFALEFEIHGSPPSVWNEWWGSLWLWAEGHVVGKPSESEMISIGLESLQEAAGEAGTRVSDLLSAQSPKEALEMVLWARYGDSDPAMAKTVGNEKSLFPFEILPRRTGPFFDGWEAILLEEGAKERFIYRQQGADVVEVVWPLGTFRDVISEAGSEFEKLARSMLNGTSSVS
jgi:hypothetical protein